MDDFKLPYSGHIILPICFKQIFSRLLAGRVHARRESIEEEEEEEEMVEEVEGERDSGLGSEESQAGSNERLLPPMEPSARYHSICSNLHIVHWNFFWTHFCANLNVSY